MTVRITVNRICDRCSRPFDGSQHLEGDKLPEYDRSHYVMTCESVNGETGEVIERKLIDYEDLCESCTGVVEKAVAKLRQEKPSPKAKESSHKPEPESTTASSRKSLAAAVVKKTKKELSSKKPVCVGCGESSADHPSAVGCEVFHTAEDREREIRERDIVISERSPAALEPLEDDLPF